MLTYAETNSRSSARRSATGSDRFATIRRQCFAACSITADSQSGRAYPRAVYRLDFVGVRAEGSCPVARRIEASWMARSSGVAGQSRSTAVTADSPTSSVCTGRPRLRAAARTIRRHISTVTGRSSMSALECPRARRSAVIFSWSPAAGSLDVCMIHLPFDETARSSSRNRSGSYFERLWLAVRPTHPIDRPVA